MKTRASAKKICEKCNIKNECNNCCEYDEEQENEINNKCYIHENCNNDINNIDYYKNYNKIEHMINKFIGRNFN